LRIKNIIVISHERSGTHFLINSIAYNFPKYSNNELSIESGNPEFIQKRLEGVETDRILKSHHTSEYFGDSLDDFHKFYIVRDGRDVLASCYHHYRQWKLQGTFSHFIKHPKLPDHIAEYYCRPFYTSHRSMPHKWVDHVKSWQGRDCWLVKYEDLTTDFNSVIRQISEKLKLLMPDKIIKPTLKNRSVQPRKGIKGDWKNYFDSECLAFFNKYAAKIMKELEYDNGKDDSTRVRRAAN